MDSRYEMIETGGSTISFILSSGDKLFFRIFKKKVWLDEENKICTLGYTDDMNFVFNC